MGTGDWGYTGADVLSHVLDPPHRNDDRDQRVIAPVNVGSQAGGFDGHGNNAVMNQLFRDETIPKFSGQGGDFDDWQWRFQRHINTLEAAHGKPLPDKIKLVILERALPDCDRRWLVVLERQEELVTYQTVTAKLRAKAEPTKETQARQKWDALSFKTNGKITGHELYRFEVDFREAQQGVPSLSEGRATDICWGGCLNICRVG